jgi:hypothetical protein
VQLARRAACCTATPLGTVSPGGTTIGASARAGAVQVVNHNVDALIKWKNRRIPFDDSATAQ